MTTPEEQARQDIDELLTRAGWTLQDFNRMNISVPGGIAVREFQLGKEAADYLLIIDEKAVGIIEAKPKGYTLSGVDFQSEKYIQAIPEHMIDPVNTPCFLYESTGVETFFRDLRDPVSRSRRVFAFHQPDTMKEWLRHEKSLRGRLCDLPPLDQGNLWDAQYEAIQNLEKSFKQGKQKALIQMATGSGKTFMAVTACYRLIKHCDAKRILFLVDRTNLGIQAETEFKQYPCPGSNRKFTELYNIQRLQSNVVDPVNKVVISTIQRLYSMLKNQELEDEDEKGSLFERDEDGEPLEVQYNSSHPISEFDFIIVDECHRSIYQKWKQVLDYYDAFIVGLTATPSIHTLGYFEQNLVMEYGHERAVADQVNVGYDVYRIQTRITEQGSVIPAEQFVDKRDRETREIRWKQLDNPVEYTASQLDRDVVSLDQIRTVVRAFKESIPAVFPDREVLPKTVVFAKDDSHADDIVQQIRKTFNKPNDFCRKITYRSSGDPDDLIREFRNQFNPRIVVSVDMISTGTDIKPVECLLFMRDVKSRTYFDQMKGRGTRVISPTELEQVNTEGVRKTRFVLIDAVGVTESLKTDTRSLERKPSVSFDKLLRDVSQGKRDVDTLQTLLNRLTRLIHKLDEEEKRELAEIAGKPLREINNDLLDAIDPDVILETAQEKYEVESPDQEMIKTVRDNLARTATTPFMSPDFREALKRIKKKSEQIIDHVSQDEVIYFGYDEQAKENAEKVVTSFKQFIKENQDQITALEMILSRPYNQRELTYESIRELAEAIEEPDVNLNAEQVWQAYKRLDASRVKDRSPEKQLTDIISLIRYSVEELEALEPYREIVDENFNEWLFQQEQQGQVYTEEQMKWLKMIKNHIATSLNIELTDLENVPFNKHGGPYKAINIFGDRQQFQSILQQLNTELNK